MDKFLETEGKRIHYTLCGSGDVMVLLHGFTESLSIWDRFSAALSQRFRVICIDLPGHGQSDCLYPIHSMEMMAGIVREVLSLESVSRCVLTGHSMGGYVSLAFAEHYPDLLAGLCLFHSSAYADSAETRQNRQRTNQLIGENHFHFLSSFIPSLFAPAHQQTLKEQIDLLVEASKQMSAPAVMAANAGMAGRPDRTHVLRSLSCPVMFVAGKLDSRVPFEKVAEQLVLPHNASALFLGDCGHMGYLEAPDETFSALYNFGNYCFHQTPIPLA